ncbi:hypothetical protein E2C01_089084 [Portunus trituberculatus]|uniref:Uncharacterized protein n=1 Tax=Portunus trituberculatus TaxID=210409 RepID=A0A5B7JI57_PORTR|nr:hypothetical protein [Portunus trituberculatus]
MPSTLTTTLGSASLTDHQERRLVVTPPLQAHFPDKQRQCGPHYHIGNTFLIAKSKMHTVTVEARKKTPPLLLGHVGRWDNVWSAGLVVAVSSSQDALPTCRP